MDTWYRKTLVIIAVALFTTLFIHACEWYATQIETDFMMVLNGLTAFTSFFLICHLLFSGKIPRKLFLALLVFIMYGACETLGIFLLNPLWSEERLILMQQKVGWFYHLCIFMTWFFSLIVSLLVKRYRKSSELVGDNRMFFLQCLLPACSVMFLYAYSAL